MSDDEIIIHCKVTSIHPSSDSYGNEYVCIEFSVEAQKPPTVMSFPSNLPQEISFVIPILSQIPKMFSQGKAYTQRLVLFLTNQEWERMSRKYQYNEEVEVRINRKDGTIKITPI
ncbi:MAG: hypothetical protein DRO36_02330 [Candidatus Hecatellales archaeon]|nr:MAG: hypothetical protein DRO36_02330 [Candidatus Hecatellales archaeon]